ncbi:DUF305 domain-containing protein [Deinococcus sp. PEB2-63]
MVVLAGLGVGGALLLAQPRPVTPAPGSPEVRFVQDMRVHHEQAVTMSVLVLKVARDRSVRSLALDIQLGQEEQNRQMEAWLRRWNAPDATQPDAMHAGMMGMATREELVSLKTLPVREAETQYLRLMRRHHQGALLMARPLTGSRQPLVAGLARQVIATQSGEIRTLDSLLKARGAQPLPAPHGRH